MPALFFANKAAGEVQEERTNWDITGRRRSQRVKVWQVGLHGSHAGSKPASPDLGNALIHLFFWKHMCTCCERGQGCDGELGQPASLLSSSPAPLAAPGSSRGPLDVTNRLKQRLRDEVGDLVSIKSADCFMAGWESCEAPGFAPLAAGSCLSIAVSLDCSSHPTSLEQASWRGG